MYCLGIAIIVIIALALWLWREIKIAPLDPYDEGNNQ